ncbi:phospholipid/cholesterol/gamma-HCH transport system permease protein [Hoyosella altamirensis]|uniref:Phospholipid/cholesterol/gamma-HCH transport system permease protein n=1 Tax=Hoyosella altamirensis TaxID=616997 RepID=A0A839RT29_9ACTN|nr:ABC transporter permease [Hoyosella altamirensis]MBB3039336.1 phospholipid/cholesterol/gamma-HCH transport system permease protein [Hoyosella altamirensis]
MIIGSHSATYRAKRFFGKFSVIGRGFEVLAMHLTFGIRMVAGVPIALKRYRKIIMREVSDVSFGSTAILSGGGTIGVVIAMSGVAAMLLGIELFRGLELLGFTALSGMVSAIANTQGVAPIVAAIALAAKVGTGFTAQLGAMRISEEIDALDTLGVNSTIFLATTRLIAMVVAIIPVYMVGLLSAYLTTRFTVVVLRGESGGTYDYYFQQSLTPSALASSITMALVFAVFVAVIHCSYGYHASGGPEGVGRAAGHALRTSILVIGMSAVVLTFGLFGITPAVPGMGIE